MGFTAFLIIKDTKVQEDFLPINENFLEIYTCNYKTVWAVNYHKAFL